jgi:2,4-dienoyl-CoA reductase-like NADH-dependent reductase (Old Yellow Enzyme family)
MNKYPTIASLKTAEQFRNRLDALGLELGFDEEVQSGNDSPLAQSIDSTCGPIGNRFAILPMEGWDGTTDGMPTELTIRRWENFGRSGAKLIWGGEAVAVREDGRANPNQLMMNDRTASKIESLRNVLESTHASECGNTDDLLVGLQLTHSGRFARPNAKDLLEPITAYQHSILDKKFNVDSNASIISDDGLRELVDQFVAASVLAEKIGFRFVDIKHCHGYFGHELLSGYDRLGEFGGSFENRTRFLRDIVAGIRAETNDLAIGVRLSIFDFSPFGRGSDGIGVADVTANYESAFGGAEDGCGIDLEEPKKFIQLLRDLGIDLLCTTAGSPYYNPHIQRPATFPPSDGYFPPEDPLVGVARQIAATAELKKVFPNVLMVGSGYSYLQDWLANVGQKVVRTGQADFVGLGRMVLSYPTLPADVIAGTKMERKKICRTFSDCTTAPRNGMVSGCYPLDPFYKSRPERQRLAELKKADD